MKRLLYFAIVVTALCSALASQAEASARMIKPNKHYFSNELIEGVKHFENHPLAIGKIKVDKLRIDKFSGKSEIGYGFTSDGIKDCIREGYLPRGYKLPRTMTRAQAHEFLIKVMLPTYQKTVKDVVKVKLEKKQQEALTMFTYNLGKGALKMLVTGDDRLNSGNYSRTPLIMLRYTSAGGKKKVKGLVKRRNYEVIKIWHG